MQSKKSIRRRPTIYSKISKQSLRDNDILLELCPKAELQASVAKHPLHTLLSHRELHWHAGIGDTLRRTQWLCGRFLLKKLIRSTFPPAAVPRWKSVEILPHGPRKPSVKVGGVPWRYDHSLSHSGNMFLAGVCRRPHLLLGVDIEFLRPVRPQVLRFFLDRKETSMIRRGQDTERMQAMFRYWTIKEATLKALGIGLAGSVRDVIVHRIVDTRADVSIARRTIDRSGIHSLVRTRCFTGILNTYAVAFSAVSHHPL
jgi:4'-phosphopantetheinyl transferase EntD